MTSDNWSYPCDRWGYDIDVARQRRKRKANSLDCDHSTSRRVRPRREREPVGELDGEQEHRFEAQEGSRCSKGLTTENLARLQRELSTSDSGLEDSSMGKRPISRSTSYPSNLSFNENDSSQSTETDKDKALTAYHRDYPLRLSEHNVKRASPTTKPRNWDTLQNLVLQASESAPLTEHELGKIYRLISQLPFQNERHVSDALFSRFFPTGTVEDSEGLWVERNRSWSRWIPPYANQERRLGAPQPDYVVGFQLDKLPSKAAEFARPSHGLLAFPVFFAEFKRSSNGIEVARSQNMNNGASAVYLLLRLQQELGKEQQDRFYDHAHVLSLDCNGTAWRLNCHWVSRTDNSKDIFYSKSLKAWIIDEDDKTLSEMRASLRKVAGWIEGMFYKVYKDLSSLKEKCNVLGKGPSGSQAASEPSNVAAQESQGGSSSGHDSKPFVATSEELDHSTPLSSQVSGQKDMEQIQTSPTNPSKKVKMGNADGPLPAASDLG